MIGEVQTIVHTIVLSRVQGDRIPRARQSLLLNARPNARLNTGLNTGLNARLNARLNPGLNACRPLVEHP